MTLFLWVCVCPSLGSPWCPHLWVSLSLSLLNVIACVLCAFLGRRHRYHRLHYMHLYFVHLYKKMTSAIAYALCAYPRRRHHRQQSLINYLCVSMHHLLLTHVCACLGHHHQNLLIFPCQCSLTYDPHPQCSFITSWQSFKQAHWPNCMSNKLNVCVHYVPKMPSLKPLHWGHWCWHKWETITIDINWRPSE